MATSVGRTFNIFFAILSPAATAFVLGAVARVQMILLNTLTLRVVTPLVVLGAYLTIGMVVFVWLEDAFSWMDALQITLALVTTVGYGDLVPSSPRSRVAAILLSLAGNGVAAMVVDTVRDAVERLSGVDLKAWIVQDNKRD